ncbi:pectate lyase superfamily protein-domain-containing protein [Aspergillus venezuelensis]
MLAGLHPGVVASVHGHHHHGHSHHSGPHHLNEREVGDSDQVIQDALKQLRVANKYRLDHPRFNRYEFKDSSTKVSVSSHSLAARATTSPSSVPGNTKESNATVYSVSSDVADAARKLAESKVQNAADENARSAIEQLKAKYWAHNNDTNKPEKEEPTFDGLLKRDSAFYWMEEMEMNGASPYAPEGYKVFRNVKDYGAVGDGTTDDTEAINLAISDGDRCGADCGSSTIRPAVVYFPKGTYLVSSSIVQYYNTQILGDPINKPTILAAASFVGLGVISSDVYIEGQDGAQWYINTNNFLRSIRNFVIDITNTDPNAYVCGIHWQVAQGTDLQNIDFYMKEGTTQQGVYMENGSGGFLTDLTFSNGNFGAYLGNQQFTSRNLIFNNCKTAIQIHWDWGWTMQGIFVIGGETGIIITGGAGGVNSNGQGVGAFLLTDTLISGVNTGISTSLVSDKSTSFVMQYTQFRNTPTAVLDADTSSVLLAGAASGLKVVDSWGFGRVVNQNSTGSFFLSGGDVPAPDRTGGLFTQNSWFSRSAPTYQDLSAAEIINVRDYGAKGDGATDDTIVLNQVLERAAQRGSVIFFPFGVYLVTDTIDVPVNSRIVGQAWSQIMGSGSRFKDEGSPRAVVQVGLPGESGILEVSDMMVTVRGSTKGAVLLQWNVHEESQGSAALWNTHIRVGGAEGSNMQTSDCPKGGNGIIAECVAASLLVHITPRSSGYFENMWVWTADHDLDETSQGQVSIYTGRGILIESAGPTWLWGTSSEHSVLYQYNLVGAQDIFMGMIQSESPYFQPVPKAPTPFTPGTFPGDPLFEDCEEDPDMCALSWGLRMVQSNNIYIYGAGLYSWFSNYNQDCLGTGCQERIASVEASSNLWLYNLATKGSVELISPADNNTNATFASDNQNGFLASIIAWLQGAGNGTTIGGRNFTGFELFERGSLDGIDLAATCIESLYQTVYCDNTVWEMRDATYHGTLGDGELTDSVCDAGCQRSLAQVHTGIATRCGESDIIPGLPAISVVERLWWAYNDTCLKDVTTGRYCNDIIATYDLTSDISDMPEEQLCSYCFKTKYQEMQKSSYSGYSENSAQVLETINSACDETSPITITDPSINVPPSDNSTTLDCISDNHYTTMSGDTCDSIAAAESVSAATLYAINPALVDCTSISAGLSLCLPETCETAQVQSADTCISLGVDNGATWRSIIEWNGALDYGCTNLVDPSPFWGKTICIGAPGDPFEFKVGNGTVGETPQIGYSNYGVVDPPAGAVIAPNTTTYCGVWYTVPESESESLTCEEITTMNSVTADQFIAYNPSLEAANCTASLQEGLTYCALATPDWDYEDEESCWGTREKCMAENCLSIYGGCGEEYAGSNGTQTAASVASSATSKSSSTPVIN